MRPHALGEFWYRGFGRADDATEFQEVLSLIAYAAVLP
jgi:hypothetical protein